VADFLILTGLSGAGRSEAAKHIEDMGWFVIDNLPPELIPDVAGLARADESSIDRVALTLGSGRHAEVASGIDWLRSSGDDRVRTLFLSARTPVLVQRYEATRRRHPYKAFGSLSDAIESERVALETIQADADVVIDTSDLHVHQLRDRIIELFGDTPSHVRLQTQVMSFGYKYGLPLDVDLVLDCRFLPNPHWVPALRPMSGRDEPVRDFVLGQPLTEPFLAHLQAMLAEVLPAYAAEGKAYLTVAFGCTGGRHRSVAIAERMASELAALGYPQSVRHTHIDR